VDLCKKVIGNIGLVLEKTDSCSSDDTKTTVYCLYITNYSKKRVTGKIIMDIVPPAEIYPGDDIMMSVKPEGTISTEFKIVKPVNSEKPALIITIQPDEGSEITARFE